MPCFEKNIRETCLLANLSFSKSRKCWTHCRTHGRRFHLPMPQPLGRRTHYAMPLFIRCPRLNNPLGCHRKIKFFFGGMAGRVRGPWGCGTGRWNLLRKRESEATLSKVSQSESNLFTTYMTCGSPFSKVHPLAAMKQNF
jgi:hypothetical protein